VSEIDVDFAAVWCAVIDVDFAAVWCAVDKEVGDGGWEDWWSDRGAACCAVMLHNSQVTSHANVPR